MRIKSHIFLWSVLGMMLMTSCGPSGPSIRIEEAWVRPDPLMKNAAGYFIIYNDGNQADTLTGVRVDFAEMAMPHQTIVDGDMHRMEHVPRLEIPADGMVEFKTMNYHVMITELDDSVEFGQTVKLVLTFEITGEIIVDAEVRKE